MFGQQIDPGYAAKSAHLNRKVEGCLELYWPKEKKKKRVEEDEKGRKQMVQYMILNIIDRHTKSGSKKYMYKKYQSSALRSVFRQPTNWLFLLPPEVLLTQQFPIISLEAVQSHQGPVGLVLNAQELRSLVSSFSQHGTGILQSSQNQVNPITLIHL